MKSVEFKGGVAGVQVFIVPAQVAAVRADETQTEIVLANGISQNVQGSPSDIIAALQAADPT